MSQRDGFAGGFLLGTIVGGVIGGVVGTLLAARQTGEPEEPNGLPPESLAAPRKKKRLFQAATGTDMETARRSLEDKIAQLNDAIDDVREQLGGVNGGTVGDAGEQAIAHDPRK